jgi:LacI family transcriptional regulator
VRGLAADAVVIDNPTAVRDAVERLLAAGHRRIALVTGGGDSGRPQGPARAISTGAERIDGCREALRAGGVSASDRYLRDTAFNQELAHRLTAELLDLEEPPTALFTSDLVVALGALRAIRSAGLTIPGDLSFVAFDDADWTTVVSPPLTVVAQPAYHMGATAAQLLIDRIHGTTEDWQEHLLPTTFVSRESVGAPRTR